MTQINATYLSHAARNWFRNARGASVLHVFENACNLTNGDGEVLSIVNPDLGPGPFTMVLAAPIDFRESIEVQSGIRVANLLGVGELEISYELAELWNARPDWEALQSTGLDWGLPILKEIAEQSEHQPGTPFEGVPDLSEAEAARKFAASLAGKGPGVTPSGDDYLMGVMHALWASQPAVEAARIAGALASAAVPLTTTLSAAWLHAAKQGKAAGLWHDLFDQVVLKNKTGLHAAAQKILSTGHSSGADALAGFLAGIKKGDSKNRPTAL